MHNIDSVLRGELVERWRRIVLQLENRPLRVVDRRGCLVAKGRRHDCKLKAEEQVFVVGRSVLDRLDRLDSRDTRLCRSNCT